jgi:hypothetical protein
MMDNSTRSPRACARVGYHTGARAEARCLLIHAEASLSLQGFPAVPKRTRKLERGRRAEYQWEMGDEAETRSGERGRMAKPTAGKSGAASGEATRAPE